MSGRMIRSGRGLQSVIDNLQPGFITVGIHRKEGKHDDSELTVANIGAIHEYGLNNMPERSFMRSTLFAQRKKIQDIIRKDAKKMLNNGKFNKTIKKLGELVRSKIQNKIVSIRTPPNSEATKARKKGVDNPLIDTGQLLGSIHSVYHSKRP